MTNLMKQKGDKKLKAQAMATLIGLCAAALIFFVSMITSKLCLDRLEDKINPLLDAALEAAEADDGESLCRYSQQIYDGLRKAEPNLKIFTSHRDIMEMMRFAEDLLLLRGNGDRMAYITDIAGIRSWLELLCESVKTTISDIL